MSETSVTTLDDASEVKPATKAAKTKQQTAATKEAGMTGDRVLITIHNGEGAAGREDVPVFVNGVAFVIKRGKPVEVPVEVVEVLKNAVMTTYENGEAIDTPRFAFSTHS